MDLNSLLNHGPAPERRSSRSSDDHYEVRVTTYEAASALTTLATLGPGQQYAPDRRSSRELPSPTSYSHAAPRRSSSNFSSHAAPVEPSPPLEPAQAHSPTLDHYHHSSASPQEQRRRSLLSASSSPDNVLAPIQSLSGVLQEQTRDAPQPPQPSPEQSASSSHGAHSPAQRPQQPPSTYGTDVSQAVPGDDSARDSTQNREPAFVRDEPHVSQIRAASPTDTSLETAQTAPTNAQTPRETETVVENGPPGPSHDGTPPVAVMQTSEQQPPAPVDNVDEETRKAIEAVKQTDLGLRKKAPSVTDSTASPDSKAAPAPSKKRPAPPAGPIKKKGTAALKKPNSKKRRVDADPDTHTRSATPTSKAARQASIKGGGRKGSQAGTPVAESSPAPDNSSPVHASDDDPESASDDNTLYCICRKPDNHRWMIGCDGGCDDWFHGSCVDMAQADEDLVDKFICPNCEAAGRGQTTWKPMCRREGCRKPAQLNKGKESKYCSEECGVLFFRENLQRTAGAQKPTKPKKSKKKSTDEGVPSAAVAQASSEDEEPTPLGGVIRAKDLKSLAVQSNDAEAFKRLGSGVLSPPQTASPTKPSFDGNGAPNGAPTPNPDDLLPYTASEREHLAALASEKAQYQMDLEVMKDREKFVSMVREQATRYAEREKIKAKEFCGYDVRLSWSDAEFVRWRDSIEGRAAFRCNTLVPSPEQIAAVDGDGDVSMVNGVNGDTADWTNLKETMCTKKRCGKHPQWQKLNLQDARFEELEVVGLIKECEKNERMVRDRARRRVQKEHVEKEVRGNEKVGEERAREGWAEVVEGS